MLTNSCMLFSSLHWIISTCLNNNLNTIAHVWSYFAHKLKIEFSLTFSYMVGNTCFESVVHETEQGLKLISCGQTQFYGGHKLILLVKVSKVTVALPTVQFFSDRATFT